MDYGLTFSEALIAQESDLNQYNDEELAMEATTTLTTQAKQSSTKDMSGNQMTTTAINDTQTAVERVTAEGEKIQNMIERKNQSALKFLNNTWDSNDTFLGQFEDYQNQYKLLDSVTLINWSYGHNADQYMVSKLTKLRAVITRNATYLNNWQNIPDDALIKQSGTALDKALITEMGAPSSIDTPNEFMGHLRTQFRGRKSQKTYRGESAKVYANEIRNFAKTKTSYKEHVDAAKRIAKSAQSTAESLTRSTKFSDQDHQVILKYLRNLYRMITLYVNMIYFVYRLSVEYILNRRVLVTKLFEK